MNRAFARYIASVLLFGSNGIVASHIALSSYEIVLTRVWLGTLVLLTICLLKRERPKIFSYPRDTLMIGISGMTMGVGWMLMYEAYVHVGVGIATLLNYVGPMIVLAASPFFFRERWTRSLLLSIGAVVVGMVLLNRISSGAVLDTWGLFCGIMSAVMYAAMVILSKKAVRLSGLSCTLLTLIGACPVVTLFVFVKQGLTLTVLPSDLLPIAVLGIVNTGFGCYLYFSSIRSLPVRVVSICGYLEPISAVVFAMLFLGEVMSPMQMVGSMLILGGVMYGEYKRRTVDA